VARSKLLRITNINPKAVVLHSLAKNQLDDLGVELAKMVDERGALATPKWVDEETGLGAEGIELMSSKRSKR